MCEHMQQAGASSEPRGRRRAAEGRGRPRRISGPAPAAARAVSIHHQVEGTC